VQARVLVFENRVAAACQACPASVRASREVLPVQFRRSQGAVNARRGVARSARILRNGPSSREDRCALAMRVVGSGKVVDVLDVQAFAPKPGEGAGALGFRVTPCPASCGAMVADAVAGAAAPVLGCRQ
jgi:hypothetical protein